MRMIGPVVALLALAACAPMLPDSNPDMPISREAVDYSSYRYAGDTVAAAPLARTEAEDVAASTLAALGEPPSTAAPAPIPAAPLQGTRGISDEQDFAAVSERETIESDAERLARQREAYQVFEPEPLPDRAEVAGPNIVEYALSTTNIVGQQRYSRGLFANANRAARACASFASDDLAQEAFLAAGGPERDRQGLDPDGDGFACGWDPAPFRRAAAAARQ